MTGVLRKRNRRLRDERGQGLVEYALILALVSLAAIVALGFLSGKINSLFSKAGNSLNNVPVAAGPGGGSGPPPGPAIPAAPPGTVNIACGTVCDDEEQMNGTTSGWSNGPILGYTWTWQQNDLSDCSTTTGWNTIDTDGGSNDPDTTQAADPDEIDTLSTDALRVRVTARNAVGTSTTFAEHCIIIEDD